MDEKWPIDLRAEPGGTENGLDRCWIFVI